MAEFCVNLFGSPAITRDGTFIHADTRKALALLAYLLISGRPHRRDALAGLLWPDYPQSNARAALRRTLSSLNRLLGGQFLQVQREEIGIQVGKSIQVDVLAFQEYLRTPPGYERIAAVERAVRLYQADFLEGFALRDSVEFDDWQYQTSERLRQEFAAALDELGEDSARSGRYDESILWFQRRLSLDRLHEDAQRRLMHLFALAGKRSDALRQFRECQRNLMEELGVPPLEETVRLHQQILENRIPPFEPFPASAEQPGRAENPRAGIDSASARLVGREMELEQLQAALELSAEHGFFIGLQGEAGIGKTALAQAFLSIVGGGGHRWVTVSCYRGEESLAYNPLVGALRASLALPGMSGCLKQQEPHWLAEAARLVPEITTLSGVPAQSGGLDQPGAKNRFYEGLRQIMASLLCVQRAGVLFFDDLHWADHATLDWLAYLARRLQDLPILVVAAWRGEGQTAENLYQLASGLARSGNGKLISLQPLTRSQTAELVRAEGFAAGVVTDQFIDRLYTESEGNPFFVVEFLRSLKDAVIKESGDEWPMPVSVRDLLLSRLRDVDEISLQVLGASAVIGRSFDFDVVLRTSGRSEEETLTSLEKLQRFGLIVEAQNASRAVSGDYDFHHEKMRSLVYERLSQARRRLLHRRAAEALSAILRFQRAPGQVASLIARHYLQAGMDQPAAEFFLQAAEHARQLFANSEAVEHYLNALRLGHPEQGRIHESLGDLLTLSGEYQQAGEQYQAAASCSQGADQARIAFKQGEVWERRGRWALAEEKYQHALDCLQDSEFEPVLASRIYAAWSRACHHRGDPQGAARMAERSLALAGEDVSARIQAHNVIGMLARSNGELGSALQHLESSLSSAESSADLLAQAAVLNNIALVQTDQRDFDRALESACAALRICQKLGDRHHEAALLNTIADIYHYSGQPETAMAYLKQAVTIFAEIGQQGREYQPEVWKLTEW